MVAVHNLYLVPREEPQLPQRVISLEAEEVLRYAVKKDVLSTPKWIFSKIKGYDVGTPNTIDCLASCNEDDLAELRGLSKRKPTLGFLHLLQQRLNEEPAFAATLTVAHLLRFDLQHYHYTLPDEHGRNQLEGELLRYWSRLTNLPVEEVRLTSTVVENYCRSNKLERSGLDVPKLFFCYLGASLGCF